MREWIQKQRKHKGKRGESVVPVYIKATALSIFVRRFLNVDQDPWLEKKNKFSLLQVSFSFFLGHFIHIFSILVHVPTDKLCSSSPPYTYIPFLVFSSKRKLGPWWHYPIVKCGDLVEETGEYIHLHVPIQFYPDTLFDYIRQSHRRDEWFLSFFGLKFLSWHEIKFSPFKLKKKYWIC